jgi:hypothetical protein
MHMPRRLAITKRVNLEGLDEGWGPDCYALVAPCSYQERLDLTELQTDDKAKAEVVKYQLDLVRKHFLSGKALFLNDSGEPELSDLTIDDIVESEPLIDLLFLAIMGVATNPKDLSTLKGKLSTPSDSTEPSESTNSTKTQ